ncbi:hypothetical protein H0O00_00910 [Candidatus Micrarchaeota archaeon]|nr:hypothetical protein [Candidatus Micrarchaeota archaeon]
MTSMKYAFGLFFLLLASALFAQGMPGVDFCPPGAVNASQVFITPSEDGKTIQMSALIFDVGTPSPGTVTQEQYQGWATQCKPAPDFQRCMQDLSLDFQKNNPQATQISYESAQTGVFVVQYFNPMGNTYKGQLSNVPGCEAVPLDRTGTAHKTDANGLLVDYTYHYGTCDLSQVASSVNNTFTVTYVPDDTTTCPSVAEYQYNNPVVTPATEFMQMVQNMLSGIAPGGIGAGGPLPCLGVFLIMGLLLASLYFAGKSPVTLLDITTPRLPTPKGVTASGQILAPFGYTEMKNAISAKRVASVAAAGKSAELLLNSMRGDADLNNARAELKNTVKNASAADKASGTMVQEQKTGEAILALGRSVGLSYKELEPLTKKTLYNYGETEHKIVNRITELAEKAGALAANKGGAEAAVASRQALMAMTIKDLQYISRTSQSLEVLTAHPDIGKRSAMHYRLTNTLKKFYGANRYAVIGGLVMGGTDSTFRSARQLGRMAKAIVTEAPGVARQTTRSTMELIGGKRAIEDLKARARTSPTAAWMAGQLDKHPSKVVVGNMFPVNDKAGHHGETLIKEAKANVLCFDMKQIYKALGVKFNITEQELADMGHKDVDILQRSGYSPKVAALEAAMREILTDNSRTMQQKHEALVALAAANGTHIHDSAGSFMQKLAAIEGSGDPDHLKYLSIQQLLEEQNSLRRGTVRDDVFVCHVGGDSLRGSQVWETMVLRTMLWDAENGHLTGGLKEELLSARLNVVNRLSGLLYMENEAALKATMEQLPEHMRNSSELKAVAERNRSDLIALFTEEGKAQYKEFATNYKDYVHGKSAPPRDINSASIGQIVEFMQGGAMQRGGHIDAKTGKMMWWGTDMELALPKNATMVDVKRHWVSQLDSRENIAISQWVESRFTKSYVPAYKASIEAELNRTPGSASWTNEQRTQAAKKIWVAEQLMQDMEQRFNSHFGQNTYGTARETSRFYGNIMAGFMEKALQEKGMENNHPDLRFLQEMDTSNPKHLTRLKELMRTYQNEYASVIGRDMTYDDLAKSNKAVVMLHEGGYAYYRKGMMLSDMDRVMAGETALRDNKGQLRKFIPEEVPVNFGARDDLAHQYGKVRSSKDPNEWTTLVESTTKWAKEGGYNYDKQKVLAAVLWEYAQTTHDYDRFWKNAAVSVEAKRQVAPVAPASLRFFGVDGSSQSHILKPFRDMGLGVGDYISKVALLSGGPLLKASYDITPTSEYLRQHSFQMSSRIMSGKGMENLTDEERVAYRNVAMQHGAYHQVWDYAIDRNPWRTSTSFGTHQAWGSFFHFGPAVPFKVRDNLRAYMDRGQYANFMVGQGFGMDFAAKLMKPYINVLRGVQMSMQGYASKWDSTDDAMKQWNYTPPRITEAMQAINPFSSRWFPGKTGERIAKLNVFGGSLERHQLAGPDYQKGLLQAPQDIFLSRKGVYASARTGEANPGASYYDYRSTLVLDSPMAEYMYRAKESAFMYDKNVQKSAMDNTVRRTVSAEALSIRRTQELQSFGILQNALFGWANPVGFVWHMPIPGYPSGATPRDLASNYMQKAKTGHGRSFMDGIRSMAEGIGQGASRMAQPHKLAMVVYCPRCGTPNYRGSTCKNASCKQIQY